MSHTAPRTAPLLYLLADDLTGACDAAVAFAARGLRTEVSLASHAAPAPAGVDVWARNSASRDTSPSRVAAGLAAELAAVPPGAILFKKIDSVFRGNTFAELAALHRLLPGHLCVLAPAFPALGRTLRDGTLHISDIAGERHIPIASTLRDLGITPTLVPAPNAQFPAPPGPQILLCDAESQPDLDLLVSGLLSAPSQLPICWIGSAGLAHALARALSPSTPAPAADQPAESAPKPGAVLMFVGSNHPVTLHQVAALQQHTHWSASPAARLITVPRTPAAPAAIHDAIGGLDPASVRCLLMTGGDTAAAVCAALGITSVRLTHEFAPGLPQGRAVGGVFDGTPLILKSGGFGAPTALCDITSTFVSPHTSPHTSPHKDPAP